MFISKFLAKPLWEFGKEKLWNIYPLEIKGVPGFQSHLLPPTVYLLKNEMRLEKETEILLWRYVTIVAS